MRSKSGNYKQLRHFTAMPAVMLLLAACATAPPRKPSAAVAPQAQPLATLTIATPDAAHDLLAQLLAGEMALTQADLPRAAGYFGRAMALSTDPHVAERAAMLAIAVHDDAAAQRALDRWQLLGATPAQMAQARAELALDRGDAAAARTELERLTGSGDKDAWRQFGRVLVSDRDQAQAARLLESLATPQRLPDDPRAWLAMSELGDKFGRHAYAMQIAQAAAQRFKNAETYAWLAQLKSRQGDRAGASALLRQALRKAPDNVAIRVAYASTLAQTRQYAAASRVLQRGPQNAETYNLRAALAAQQKDNKALDALYRQLQQAPADVRSRNAYLLGQLAESQHHDEQALAWYSQVGEGDAHAFDADLRSAIILQGQGKSSEAHQLLAQMQLDYLDQPAQLGRAYQLDAELYLGEKRYPEAIAAFSHALLLLPNDPRLLYGRGLAYAEADQVDQAVADFRHLLQIKPGDVEASNALGFTLADADRDLPEAERLIQVARAAKPADPSIADSWGWLQYRLGHLDQAAQTLAAAWKAHKDADVGVHLGEVLWKQGHRQEAQRVFGEVRRIDPTSSSLRDTLRRLQP